ERNRFCQTEWPYRDYRRSDLPLEEGRQAVSLAAGGVSLAWNSNANRVGKAQFDFFLSGQFLHCFLLSQHFFFLLTSSSFSQRENWIQKRVTTCALMTRHSIRSNRQTESHSPVR